MTLPPSVAPRRAADLLADPSALREWITRYGEHHGSARFPVASALAFKAYTWALIEVAVGRWVAERRVVDVSPSRVCVRTESADEPRLEFLALHYTVLPDDPDEPYSPEAPDAPQDPEAPFTKENGVNGTDSDGPGNPSQT